MGNGTSSTIVPSLPALTSDALNHRLHSAWHNYVKDVYGEDIPDGETLILNNFNFFYTTAPFKYEVSISYLGKHKIQLNEAWDGSVVGLVGDEIGRSLHKQWGDPASAFSRIGFFVRRETLTVAAIENMMHTTGRLEVCRVRAEERHVAWFYLAIGSGIFLDLEKLLGRGKALVVQDRSDIPGWDTEKGDVDADKIMHEAGLSVAVFTSPFQSATTLLDAINTRVEIVVAIPQQKDPLSTCPFENSAQYLSTGISSKNRLPCTCDNSKKYLNCNENKVLEESLSKAALTPFRDTVGALLCILLILVLFWAIFSTNIHAHNLRQKVLRTVENANNGPGHVE